MCKIFLSLLLYLINVNEPKMRKSLKMLNRILVELMYSLSHFNTLYTYSDHLFKALFYPIRNCGRTIHFSTFTIHFSNSRTILSIAIKNSYILKNNKIVLLTVSTISVTENVVDLLSGNE